MQPRRIARELALLSRSQISKNPANLEGMNLNNLLLAAVRTLSSEMQETLETAAAELQRGDERLLSSETKAPELNTAKVMVREAIDLAEKAINRIGRCQELPEMLQLANQQEVREYTLEILKAISRRSEDIEQVISQALEGWTIDRLARIDRDILRIAVAEINYLGLPERVAINEAVELAKRYSDEEGHRFINGVLRRIVEPKF
jgi:N utilization substance protein B